MLKVKENQLKENKQKDNKEDKGQKNGIFKYITLKTLIIITILLVFNSYAWFVYSTKVATGLEATVTSWNVSFEVGDDESVTNILIDVDRIYPGMTTYTKVVKAENKGEMSATLSYEYNSFTILGTNYVVGETLTEEQLADKIENDYPFKISVNISNTEINTDTNGEFTITVSWAYESGDDETDTSWGQQAYDFYQTNPTDPAIHIELLLIAKQHQ